MSRLTNHYSNDSHELLTRSIERAREAVARQWVRQPGLGPGDYEAFQGRRSEASRVLGIMLEEQAWRDANPGGYEREQEQKARLKKMFGY